MASVFISGGAGFIGSQMAERLLAEGHSVVAYDNLVLGRREFLAKAMQSPKFRFVEADLLDLDRTVAEMQGVDLVIHLAANSDISQGAERSDVDLRNGTIATYNTLEAMRRTAVRDVLFASTSAIYGEASVKPTPESYGPLFPISFYGASKLACEGLISAFVHNCGMRAIVFRFANIVGPRATHGAIHDFLMRLKANPRELRVLGNGTQRKSYLHVSDCIDGMLYARSALFERSVLSAPQPQLETAGKEQGFFECYNLASEGVTQVSFIAAAVVDEVARRVGVKPALVYGAEDRGWVGDVPFTWLDGARFAQTGWKAKLRSDAAVEQAVREVAAQIWGAEL